MIKNFLPRYYEGIHEFEQLNNVENSLFSTLSGDIEDAKANQFIAIAKEDGISDFESMLGIIPDIETETIEERRSRVLNRLSMNAPFSIAFLRAKLDDLIGAGEYNLVVDYDSYTIYLENANENQFWYQELNITLNAIKPVNMRFINMPYVYKSVKVSNNSLVASSMVENYILGAWRLGLQRFMSAIEEEAQEMINKKVEDNLTKKIASYIGGEVSSVLINNSIKVYDFAQTPDADTLKINFEIAPGQVAEITNISLLDKNGDKLTNVSVYIPVMGIIHFQYEIKIKDGDSNGV